MAIWMAMMQLQTLLRTLNSFLIDTQSVFDMSETKISDANLPDSNMAAVDVGISSLADMKERIALAREL
eukprot:483459-Hanusia_phi.AAC.2